MDTRLVSRSIHFGGPKQNDIFFSLLLFGDLGGEQRRFEALDLT